jgi:putative CocE/NonD family hydrolase
MAESKIDSSYAHAVREIDNVWITLSDGCRLAARMWIPKDAERNPVPAILEYLPYRKRDGTAVRDQLTHPWYAGHGYAALRVDMRGNGESDGLMLDEYLPQEQDDALEVIAWIASQPWCDGAVGMMGISWGGFNSLQVAARRPPALKAIITLCSTDDRYADDIHYKGGAMLMENFGWAATMFAYSSRPPDPELVGKRWRDTWIERLENTPLLIENWLRHPHRDDYWKHGSVCEGFGDIEAATYVIGGWGDAYSNAIPRMLTGLRCPVKGLIGPWIHKYPHVAVPEPGMNFLEDSLAWWDRWLKGRENGVMQQPLCRVYMMDGVEPAPYYARRDGRWVAATQWPSADVSEQKLYLAHGRLTDAAPTAGSMSVSSPQHTGVAGGEYCAMWQGPESPTDQRVDDAGSLLFDGEVLKRPLEILGAPAVEIELCADRPQANIAARLCDVWPSGESTRITWGVLNLCHRHSHEHPEPLEPGKTYRVRIRLDDVAYRVKSGNRLRLALSTAYWPLIWPSQEHATATVFAGSSTLTLPLRTSAEDPLPAPDPPVTAPPLKTETIRPPSAARAYEMNLVNGECVMRIDDDFGEHRDQSHGLVSGQICRERYSITGSDPASCRAQSHWTQKLARDGWSVRTETRTTMRCDRDNFYIDAHLEAFEDDCKIFERSWRRRVNRSLV